MKNKLMASALVLGFSIAPAAAFASVTTTQGGTPVYSCLPGQQLVDTDKCLTPATTITEQVEVPAQSVPATSEITGTTWYSAFCASAYGGGYRQRTDGNCYHISYNDEWFPSDNVQINTYEYSCPEGATLNGTNCDIPARVETVETPVPAQTTAATIAGSNGGSLIASVTGFLSPVWDFIQSKLLPAIAALVALGIGVRLSIKAVRKFSKVA